MILKIKSKNFKKVADLRLGATDEDGHQAICGGGRDYAVIEQR